MDYPKVYELLLKVCTQAAKDMPNGMRGVFGNLDGYGLGDKL